MTVRLSPEEHEKLQQLADGMSLSVYMRAKALAGEVPRRRRKGSSVEDREAIAQLLGLLGQSRIANNLNQLAHHANIGTLPVDDATKADLDEAYRAVIGMRQLLLRALGYRT